MILGLGFSLPMLALEIRATWMIAAIWEAHDQAFEFQLQDLVFDLSQGHAALLHQLRQAEVLLLQGLIYRWAIGFFLWQEALLQLRQDMFGRKRDLSAICNELIGSAAGMILQGSRHGKDLAVELHAPIHGIHGSGFTGGLDHYRAFP